MKSKKFPNVFGKICLKKKLTDSCQPSNSGLLLLPRVFTALFQIFSFHVDQNAM